MGRQFPGMGFLIAKDPEQAYMMDRKHKVPGVIGSNIFQFMRHSLVDELGSGWLPRLLQEPDGEKWASVMCLYESIGCNQIDDKMPTVICKNKELIPARSLKVIECTSKQKYHNIDHYAVVDRQDDIALSLLNGLVVANCIVCVKSECTK